jgi:hypothetical protein
MLTALFKPPPKHRDGEEKQGNMIEDDRKKAALIRLRALLPALGRKLDRCLSSHDERASSALSFAELADKVANLLGPSAKA